MSDTSQGPGWWQASDGKWYPPEQAPGYQAPATASGPAPAPASTPTGSGIADAFNYSWLKFQQNVGPILIVAVIGFGVLVVLTIIWWVVQISAFAASTTCHTDATTGLQACHTSGGGFLAWLLSLAVFTFLFILGIALWQMAIIRGALMIVNGEHLEVSKMFGTDQLGAYIIAAVLVAIATGIGYFLCIVPGVVFLFFAQWFGWFVIGKQMAPIDAIKASFSFVNAHLGTLIGFYLACLVAYIVGAILCYIGLIVAVPVVIIAQGYMFRRLQGEPVAA